MLHFLRQIRRSLIGAGATRKYLLYAMGEILLVMIGILLALQVNNWNESRKDRVKEKGILIELSKNLEINIHAIESNISELQKLNISSKIVLSILDNKLPYHDSLDLHFHRSRVPKSDLHISQAGYEQYKQVGFNIIRLKSLKDEVLNLFESTYPEFYIGFRQINENYVPFVDHHVPLFIYKTDQLKPIDFQALYDDNYFIGWIRAYMEGRNTLIFVIEAFLEEVRRVHQLIVDELK
jgi:hypothetical protein